MCPGSFVIMAWGGAHGQSDPTAPGPGSCILSAPLNDEGSAVLVAPEQAAGSRNRRCSVRTVHVTAIEWDAEMRRLRPICERGCPTPGQNLVAVQKSWLLWSKNKDAKCLKTRLDRLPCCYPGNHRPRQHFLYFHPPRDALKYSQLPSKIHHVFQDTLSKINTFSSSTLPQRSWFSYLRHCVKVLKIHFKYLGHPLGIRSWIHSKFH